MLLASEVSGLAAGCCSTAKKPRSKVRLSISTTSISLDGLFFNLKHRSYIYSVRSWESSVAAFSVGGAIRSSRWTFQSCIQQKRINKSLTGSGKLSFPQMQCSSVAGNQTSRQERELSLKIGVGDV